MESQLPTTHASLMNGNRNEGNELRVLWRVFLEHSNIKKFHSTLSPYCTAQLSMGLYIIFAFYSRVLVIYQGINDHVFDGGSFRSITKEVVRNLLERCSCFAIGLASLTGILALPV